MEWIKLYPHHFYDVFSKENKKIRTVLVGRHVSAIPNIFMVDILKNGDLSDTYAAFVKQDASRWKLRTDDPPKIKAEYRPQLQNMFDDDYLIRQTHQLVNVDEYLDDPNKKIKFYPNFSVSIWEYVRLGIEFDHCDKSLKVIN